MTWPSSMRNSATRESADGRILSAGMKTRRWDRLLRKNDGKRARKIWWEGDKNSRTNSTTSEVILTRRLVQKNAHSIFLIRFPHHSSFILRPSSHYGVVRQKKPNKRSLS